MSGYATRDEAIGVLRASIVADSANTGLSRDPKDYNMTGLVREVIRSRGSGYGWSIELDSAKFVRAISKHLRKRARPTNLVCIDADCPGCGYPERRLNLDTGVFSCSGLNPNRCHYESKERDA